MEVAKRKHAASSEWTYLEETPLVSPKVAVGQAQKLAHASRRFSETCHHRWLFAGSFRKMECMWVDSGAVVAHAQSEKTEAGIEKKKVAGWSTNVLEQSEQARI